MWDKLKLGSRIKFAVAATLEVGEGEIIDVREWSARKYLIEWVSKNGDKHIEPFEEDDLLWWVLV